MSVTRGAGFKAEQIDWDQGLEEEMESAGSEHTSHLSSKNPGTKPSPPCAKQQSPHFLPPGTGGEGEGLFWSGVPSLTLLPRPAVQSQGEENSEDPHS